MKRFFWMVLVLVVSSGYAEENKNDPAYKAWKNDDPVFLEFKKAELKTPKDRNTYFVTLSEFGRTNIVRALLEKGVDVNARSSAQWTPLHYAAFRGNLKLAELLIAHGADINARGAVYVYGAFGAYSKCKETPLFMAAREGHMEIVKLLLAHKAKINIPNFQNYTPLHAAVEKKNTEIVKLLLSKGADLKTHDTWYGNTPFMDAPFEIKRFLVAYGADIHTKDKTGKTTMDYLDLYWKGKKDDVKNFILKIEQLQKEKFQYFKQQQKFFMAVTSGDIKTVNKMLKEGFTPEDIFYEKSNTPLHWAADWGQKEMVNCLLSHAADLTVKNKDNLTPLELAGKRGDKEIISILEKAATPEVQALIKAGEKEKVREILNSEL